MYYIQETDKPKFLFKLFNIIKVKENKIILPIKDEKISIKKAEKLVNKTKNILDKTNCNKVVLSKVIKTQEDYKNYLYSSDVNIIKAEQLTEILLLDILNYIKNKKALKPEELSLTIFVNDISMNMLENLKIMVKEYKRINIITNHIQKFKKLEEDFFEEQGIIITVGNNKRKSALKSNIIINVDFPNELINQYNINDEAIIINLRGNIKINKKRFTGININDYEIDFDNFEEFDYEKEMLFDKKDIYEAEFIKNQPFKYSRNDLNKYKVKIIKLWKRGRFRFPQKNKYLETKFD